MNNISSTSANTINPCGAMGEFNKLCNLNSNNLGTIVGSAVNFILIIAVVVALFYLVWNGVRWIASGGDKQKVENARNGIIAAIVGLVIAFLSFFILSFALSFFGLKLNDLSLPVIPSI